MRLVPGGGCSLANGVHESYTLKPFLVGQLNLADEVMKVSDQLAHDKTRPVWHIWSDSVDDGVGEVGIEAVRAILLNLRRCLCVWVHFGCVVIYGIKVQRVSMGW